MGYEQTMLTALDAMIAAGAGGRRVVALRQGCALFLKVGIETTDETASLFDELMATLAMDLDDDTVAVLGPEMRQLPGVLPAFCATVMSRFHEVALRAQVDFAEPSPQQPAEMQPAPEQPAAELPASPAALAITLPADVEVPEPLPVEPPSAEVPAPEALAPEALAPETHVSEPVAPSPLDRRAKPRDPAADRDDPMTLARRATPEQLLAIAGLPHLPEILTSILVGRGDVPAIVTALGNPGAAFARSSLTTLAELAAGDRALRTALQARDDLPEAVVDRLLPVLGREARARLLMTGRQPSVEEARQALADAEADMQAARAAGRAPAGLDALFAGVTEGEMSTDSAVLTLAGEGRLAELAAFAATRLGTGYAAAYAMLCARLDHPAAILTKALGCTEAAALACMTLRRTCGLRDARDTRGAYLHFASTSQEEARVTVMLIDRAMLEREAEAETRQEAEAPLALAG